MAYRVEIARNAEAELEELYLWVVERGRRSKVRPGSTVWSGPSFRSTNIRSAVPVAPESIDPDHPVRVLSYGRKPHGYRVFFTVDDDTSVVRVVHVRRGARRRPTPGELSDK